MSLPADFKRRLEIRANELKGSVSQIVREVALKVDEQVVKATPVDTGVARSNWVAALNTPARGVRGAYAPGSKLGLGEGANAQAAMDQAKGVTSQFKAGENQTIWISNNTPYISILNSSGTPSQQASPNFVETAAMEGLQIVTNKRRKLLK